MRTWIEKRITQGLAGIARFRMAFVLSVLFFLTAFFYLIGSGYLDEALWYEARQTSLQCMVALGLTSLFSLFWTLLSEKRNWQGGYLSLIPLPVLLISFAFCRLMPMTAYFYMYVTGMMLILPCLAMAVLSRSVKGTLFSYIFASFFKALGMGILAMLAGFVLVLGIQTLLTPISGDWIGVVVAFAFAVFGFNTFLSYLPKLGDTVNSGGMLKLLSRVVFPFYGSLLLILYLYMGKIAYLGSMPEGTMNWYASFALAAYALFYFCLSEKGEIRHQTWLFAAGLALVPVMIVQAYGIYIRYDAYGLTAARYASMGCNLFGLCVVIAGIAKRWTDAFYGLAALLIFLFTLTPLNVIDVPVYDQGHRMEQVLEANHLLADGKFQKGVSLSQTEEDNLVSAYQYVRYSEGAFRFPVTKTLADDEDFQQFINNHYNDEDRMSYYRTITDLPVAGYSHVYTFQLYGDEPPGDIEIPAGEGTVLFHGAAYAAYVEENRNTMDEASLLTWEEEGGKLCFEDVSIRHDGGYHFSGYLLVK